MINEAALKLNRKEYKIKRAITDYVDGKQVISYENYIIMAHTKDIVYSETNPNIGHKEVSGLKFEVISPIIARKEVDNTIDSDFVISENDLIVYQEKDFLITQVWDNDSYIAFKAALYNPDIENRTGLLEELYSFFYKIIKAKIDPKINILRSTELSDNKKYPKLVFHIYKQEIDSQNIVKGKQSIIRHLITYTLTIEVFRNHNDYSSIDELLFLLNKPRMFHDFIYNESLTNFRKINLRTRVRNIEEEGTYLSEIPYTHDVYNVVFFNRSLQTI